MPGRGRVTERLYSADELDAFARAGIATDRAGELLGTSTCDVDLNDHVYWRNVPARVWDYHIGGYHVIKKWLSYRERDLLGRSLTTDEARAVTAMTRRLATILLLEPELDKNYRAATSHTYNWPREEAAGEELAPVVTELE